MNKDILNVLACPVCKGDLILEEEQMQEGKILSGYLVCQVCKERYPVIDGIPNLLPPDLR